MDLSILDLDKQLCFRLYSVSRKMTKAYQPLLEKYDLTYPQYIVMLGVFETKKIDFKELGEKVNLQTGTLTPIVQKLEKMGYVKREKNTKDYRKINVTLTQKGESLNTEIIDVPFGLSTKLQISMIIKAEDEIYA